MYGAALWTHSWLRWLVLGVGVVLLAHALLVRAGRTTWTPASDRLARAFLGLLDTQMLLGILLWTVLSPLPRTGLADLGAALSNAPVRFFTIEHPFGMLLGVVVAHMGLVRARRLDIARRPVIVLVTLAGWLLVTMASVPWPPLPYGRPLFRIG